MADWSQLPFEILSSISRRISGDVDLLRFRSVCTSWRSSCPLRTHPMPFFKFPRATRNGGSPTYSFCLQRRTVFLVRLIHGYDQSWLLLKSSTVSFGRMEIYCPFSADRLLYSFKNRVLDLQKCHVLELVNEYVGVTTVFMPHCLAPWTRKRVRRVAIIRQVGSESNSFALLAHHFDGDLALFRSTDTDWTKLRNTRGVTDMASFNGNFYAVDEQGRTFMVDPYANLSPLDPVGAKTNSRRFLVESGGELLLVEMDSYVTNPGSAADLGDGVKELAFRIHKLDAGRSKWEEAKSLEDGVLFLGEVGSFSAPASQLGWPRGNFIYFAVGSNQVYGDVKLSGNGGKRSVYVYDLEKGEICPLEHFSNEFKFLILPPPEWLGRVQF